MKRAQSVAVAVLVSGNGSNLQSLIDATEKHAVHFSIKLVISNVVDAFALTRAEQAGIATEVIPHNNFSTREEFDAQVARCLRERDIDFVILAGFMRRLTAGFVQEFAGRLINIHPSLLPRHPGLNTHQKALSAGDRHHGCTVHFVSDKVDAGPIIAQSALLVNFDESEKALKQRVLSLEHQLYWLVVEDLAMGNVTLSNGKVSYRNQALSINQFPLEL